MKLYTLSPHFPRFFQGAVHQGIGCLMDVRSTPSYNEKNELFASKQRVCRQAFLPYYGLTNTLLTEPTLLAFRQKLNRLHGLESSGAQ